MKFSDGYWRVREGFSAAWARQTHDVEKVGKQVRAHVAAHLMPGRGDTLGGPLFTVTLSTPAEGVIRVTEEHFRGHRNPGPEFDLTIDPDAPFEVSEDDEKVTVAAGELEAEISKNDWNLSFKAHGKELTGTAYKGLGHYTDPQGKTYLREQLRTAIGEKVYGFGERFGQFVKNGQSVEMWNSDAGTTSDAVYKAIPFYWTTGGYGVFVNDPGDVSFEVTSENVEKVQFSVKGEKLDYFVIYGPTPKEILRRYTALTGRAPHLPAWSYGLWLTTSFLTDYDDTTVNGFVDGLEERDIPLSVFHYDCFWQKEFHFCDFEWDNKMFPHPEESIEKLHRKGLKVCVWINPYISSMSKLFDEGMEKGYLITTADGSVYETDFWQPGMALVDFSKPEACDWYASKLETLLDMGVDCFKTDFGESVPKEAVYEDGSNPLKMHNYYTYLYNKTVFDLLERKKGKEQAVLFARSATVGGQKLPVHWGGDCESTYHAMANSLRGGLSLMASGFGYWAHDIGGFEGTPTPDLYKRWVQFGLLSSHSRLHGSKSVRVPWAFDDESSEVLRTFTDLKLSLLPELAIASHEVSDEGTPVMRPMVLEFPDDPTVTQLDRQYMLGDNLLVAPIFSPDGVCEYYVPEGTWTNYLTGEVIEGPTWKKEKFDYFSLPLLARPGAVLPVQDGRKNTDGDLLEAMTFKVFAPHAIGNEWETRTLYRGFGGDAQKVEARIRNTGDVLEMELSDPTIAWSLQVEEIVSKAVDGKARVEMR